MMPPGFGLLENGNGHRPQMMMATRGIGMPMDLRDMQAMAAHRHRILIAESSAQRMEMEGHMQAIPAQMCPPGFRPPLLHSELPPPGIFPPGFQLQSAMLPQSCPPGFRPPVQHVESASIMQPETITYRPEFQPAGMHGAGDRHGWFPNESSSGAGRVLESHPQLSKPYGIEDEHLRNLYRAVELERNWRLPDSELLSPVRAQPLAFNPEAFWPGIITQGDSLEGTGERLPDNSPQTPPYKRQRTGHEVESTAPVWAKSRLESEVAWSNGLRMSDDRSQKQTERSNGTWYDRQELRTRRSPPHYRRGSLSPDRNRAEVSRSRPKSLRASPRPVYADGNEEEHSRSPTRCSNHDRRSSGSGGRSWQKDSRQSAGKSSSGVDIDPWRSGKVGRKIDENGLHTSRVFEERSKDDRGRIDSQKENSGRTGGSAAGKSEIVAPAFTDGRPSFLPGKGTIQKLPERMPFHKIGSTEKARLSSSKHGEYQCASGKPTSATSLKITRYFTDDRSAAEVDRKASVEKAATWRRRTVFVAAAEEQDEAEEGEVLHIGNRPKASRLQRNSVTSETETTEGGLLKPFVAPPESIVHSPSLLYEGESQVGEKAGQKWIFTGSRSKHNFPKTATGSDSQSPDSLGKSLTVLTEDAPCLEEGSPTSTVRNGRVSVIAGVPTSELVSLVKEQVGELRSDVENPVSTSATENAKPSFVGEKRSLQELTVQRRDPPVSSGQFRCSRVGDVKAKQFVKVPRSLLDEWLAKITSSIPLATNTDEGLISNGSTSDSLQVPVLQHSSTSEGEKQAVSKRTTSVQQLAKVVPDRKKPAVVQGKQDTKVVPQPSHSALGGDKLARQGPIQGDLTRKMAGAGLSKAMSVVSQRPGLQELRNPGGNSQAEQMGKVTGLAANLNQVTTGEGDVTLSDSEDDFEVITEPSRGFVTHFDRQLGKKRKMMHPEEGGVLSAANTPAKMKKVDVPEQNGGLGNLTLTKKHVPILKGGIQRTSPVMKIKPVLPPSVSPAQTPPSRIVGRSYMSNKTWRREATPATPANTPQKPAAIAQSTTYIRKEATPATPVNTQKPAAIAQSTTYIRKEATPATHANTPQKPAVIAQPTTYIRKKFSIVRNPASQVPQSNVGAQPNMFPRFPQNKTYSLSASTYSLSASKSKLQGHPTVATSAASASASPGAASSNTKTTELLAIPSAKPSPSPVAAKPSPSPVAAKPSPSPVASKPSPSPVAAKPSPSPVAAKPSPSPVASKPSPSPVTSKLSPSPVPAKPSPSPVTARPSSSPVAGKPSPAPVAAKPSPSPVAAKPSPSSVAAKPSPSPVAAMPSPSLMAAKPSPSPVAGKPSPSPVAAKPSPSFWKRLQAVGDVTSVTQSESLSVSQLTSSKPSHREGSSGLTTSASSPISKSIGGATTDETVGYVVSGSRLYRKRKFDQVHVGLSTSSASPALKFDVPQGYIRRKTNQLVRCDHPGAGGKGVLEDGDHMKVMIKQRRYSYQLKTKTKLGRVLSYKEGSLPGLARVWTLSNEVKQTSTALGTSRDWRYPLFPWKRPAVVAPRSRRGRSLHEGKMGALFFHISNQLQKYRTAHPVYTRSADGFSLHRSGVVSKSGANLKWTKSLKTQSILASEAATKVVAEAEKKKRDKKEAVVMAVAKARGERRTKLHSGSMNPPSVSSLKPLGIGGSVYVRKGFGNQLVRNLKTVARAVAGEKFRWSLRNARLRRAKKQSYCVYYTRFGVCKRGDGKCLYIHDPEKIAVCTKFLRGSCSDSACRLTHKVIPERMSDCSYFLEGLCTNESCPYRHVNVNKEAPICDAFLQGYCADGDKCPKKHTYVCPEYTLTGSCPSSTCKLRHPKKATKESADPEKEPKRELQKGRYFTLPAPAEEEQQGQPIATANKIEISGDDLVDFISID